MKKIPVGKGRFTLVDDEDFAWLSQRAWKLNAGGYVRRTVKSKGKCITVSMHRAILKPSPGMLVDHADGDKLNNQKSNLRECTYKQNNANRRSSHGKSSRFKGVTWHRQLNKWQAGIVKMGRFHYLGVFGNEVDAAMAYDDAAREYHGEFMRPNLPYVGEKEFV